MADSLERKEEGGEGRKERRREEGGGKIGGWKGEGGEWRGGEGEREEVNVCVYSNKAVYSLLLNKGSFLLSV